ncbi:DUF1700 domain-containing protein [uncultured Dubosiella sp.]|jgi:uncharacterized membrane protein|uniref:DUF1700 domain-containing protein n=2 Tax=uncultured Dubosiella sp. TaxID=1937011 RepID=UPI00208A9EC8|nr:DUF1700 domain-containing protein [uncultured Dubosiella sp.]GJM56871.1 hypothetical protein EROP_05640 [Erysipelotrichaceae bacterium OPF54]
MTKSEYIQIVQSRLSGLDRKDVSDALVYLNEYFEEAGAQHEQDVIAELGAPDQYAAIIRADLAANVPPRIPVAARTRESDHSAWKTIGIIVLGICALPIALPLMIAVLALVFAAVVTMLALLFALGMCVLAFVLAFFACIYQFVVTLGTDGMVTLFLLGVILGSAGVVILTVLAIGWIVKVGFPALGRTVARLYRRLRNRGE